MATRHAGEHGAASWHAATRHGANTAALWHAVARWCDIGLYKLSVLAVHVMLLVTVLERFQANANRDPVCLPFHITPDARRALSPAAVPSYVPVLLVFLQRGRKHTDARAYAEASASARCTPFCAYLCTAQS